MDFSQEDPDLQGSCRPNGVSDNISPDRGIFRLCHRCDTDRGLLKHLLLSAWQDTL